MKSVLISIQPQWCELIFSGEKTIEVRKTAPKLETPFKVYVYQTKHKGKSIVSEVLSTVYGGGKVIGEFVCDKVEEYEGEFWDDDTYERIQEPWEPSDFAEYGEYEYDTIGENGEFYGKGIELSKQSCLSWNELRKYVGQGLKDFYGWHITDLKIYDKPKELSEFYTLGNCEKYDFCNQCKNFHRGQGWLDGSYYDEDSCLDNTRIPVTRAPMSWRYVEERKDD